MKTLEQEFDSCVEVAREALLRAKNPITASVRIYLDGGSVPEVEYEIKEGVMPKIKDKIFIEENGVRIKKE